MPSSSRSPHCRPEPTCSIVESGSISPAKASILVPGIAIPNADFVGEGQPIPVQTAPTSAGPTLTPFKIAVMASLTRELIDSSNAEDMVRQVLVEGTGPAIDKVL